MKAKLKIISSLLLSAQLSGMLSLLSRLRILNLTTLTWLISNRGNAYVVINNSMEFFANILDVVWIVRIKI